MHLILSENKVGMRSTKGLTLSEKEK